MIKSHYKIGIAHQNSDVHKFRLLEYSCFKRHKLDISSYFFFINPLCAKIVVYDSNLVSCVDIIEKSKHQPCLVLVLRISLIEWSPRLHL